MWTDSTSRARPRRSLNVNSIHGPVVNLYQPAVDHAGVPRTDRERRSAGGSSGGSAASVAAEMCDACVLVSRS